MTEIKICGITRREDAEHAVACGADALGFIFYRGTPRGVTPAAAAAIIARLPARVCRVGVFVNEEAAVIGETAATCGLDMLQLHGDESPAYCRDLADHRLLIKALPLTTEADLHRAVLYPVTAILVDARDGDRYGGTGKAASWGLAARLGERGRVILAGGLNGENIRAALRTVRPRAVDINSGVESAPGVKDPAKVAEIIRLIREADQRANGEDRDAIFLARGRG
ncbi:MAG: phosphoribosylanthranilate isomerase [Pseudomonadota bacterium]|nr:phosphoribosylanthranilate isomerase [Pseudomonadota bacterium]